MSAMLPTLVPALGWALLDFLWQGAAIGLAAALLLAALRDARPQARYAVACAALALCALLPIVALVAGTHAASGPAAEASAYAAPATALVAANATAASIADAGWRAAVQDRLAWIVALWSLGAGLLALRLVAGIAWVGDVRARARPVDAAWQARLDRLAGAVGVRTAVQFATASHVDGPVVAGWWRPVVLVPAALLARLPTDLVEALLAHELAHIRRHDYLVNLLQGAIEAVLFYHPVVWWLSRRIRIERELIADDLALRAIHEPRRLARALQQLDLYQSMRASVGPANAYPGLLPAADGGKLMSRIQRLVIRPRVGSADWRVLVPLAGLALATLGVYAKTPEPLQARVPAAIAARSAVTPIVAPVPVGARVAVAAPAAVVAPVAASTGIAVAAAPAAHAMRVVNAVPAVAPVAAVPAVAAVAAVAPVAAVPAVAAVAAAAPVAAVPRRAGRRQPYALVRGGDDSIMMAGDTDDIADVKRLRQDLKGDFLWFRRNGTDYVVRDAAVLARARQSWGPAEALARQMEVLGAQMEPHSRKMEALGRQMETLSKRSDPQHREMEQLAARMEPLGEKQRVLAERMGALGQRMGAARTDAERDRLSAQMDALQSQMAPLGAQMEQVGALMHKQSAEQQRFLAPMADLGRQMEAASAPMQPLGEKMGALGKRQEALTLKADAEVQALIDQSVRDGKAVPAR